MKELIIYRIAEEVQYGNTNSRVVWLNAIAYHVKFAVLHLLRDYITIIKMLAL